ncbi:hypothetical protein DAPPUDRAFT_123885 [Paramuricea clavata]|uniref:Uncharacterized protein n=1 Tax=Paramuricea clavata TaxID=317549 RepID=A0A6S7LV10_PARCT|nr:hypothetical protein DAPPUDRAFT_123885 [Paramuricea clavata]
MNKLPTADEILNSVAPTKSKSAYDKAWESFLVFCDSNLTPGTEWDDENQPKEDNFIKYFYHLRTEKEFKASSLWTTYSRLNNCFQRRYGKKLQQWPRITLLLKQYEHNYERKVAKIFSPEEINRAIQLHYSTPDWILRKCAVVLAYCGGMRCIELKSLTYDAISRDEEGVWVAYRAGKQKGEVKKNKFLVPYNKTEPSMCFATRVIQYMDLLTKSLPDIKDTDELFHTCTKSGYGKAVMGRNYIHQIGQKVAEELHLENPKTYTGHCFRRTAATAAANAGANTLMMKRHFDWKQDATALKYCDETKDRARKMAKLLTGSATATSSKTENGEISSQVVATTVTKTGSGSTVTKCSHSKTCTAVADDGKKVFNINLSGNSNISLYFN